MTSPCLCGERGCHAALGGTLGGNTPVSSGAHVSCVVLEDLRRPYRPAGSFDGCSHGRHEEPGRVRHPSGHLTAPGAHPAPGVVLGHDPAGSGCWRESLHPAGHRFVRGVAPGRKTVGRIRIGLDGSRATRSAELSRILVIFRISGLPLVPSRPPRLRRRRSGRLVSEREGRPWHCAREGRAIKVHSPHCGRRRDRVSNPSPVMLEAPVWGARRLSPDQAALATALEREIRAATFEASRIRRSSVIRGRL